MNGLFIGFNLNAVIRFRRQIFSAPGPNPERFIQKNEVMGFSCCLSFISFYGDYLIDSTIRRFPSR